MCSKNVWNNKINSFRPVWTSKNQTVFQTIVIQTEMPISCGEKSIKGKSNFTYTKIGNILTIIIGQQASTQ